MPTDKKIQIVQHLTDKLSKAKSVVFADYTGLKHKQLETLRKDLKKVQADFVVVKNKLLERSLRQAQGKLLETNADMVAPMLKENTGLLLNYEDEVSGIKALLKFFKVAAMGKTKGGLLGMTVLSQNDVIKLSVLPGKQELLGSVAGQLLAPLSGLHYALQWNINRLVWALDGIKNKK